MFSFSTCWNSHRHTDGREMLLEIRDLGFEYAELGHAIRMSLVDGIQKAVALGEIKISSLHNFCPLPLGVNGPAPDYYLPSSPREEERQLAVRHTLRTIEFAAMVGAPAVVLHLGIINMRQYTEKLLELFARGRAETPKFERIRTKAVTVRADKKPKYFQQVLHTLDAVVPRAKELKVKLGLETRFGVEEIPSEDEVGELVTRYGADACGYWHDIGHAQVKENFGITSHEAVLHRYRGRTLGMHLQDFAPPAFDHQPPGFGTFDFNRLGPFLNSEMILAWEIHKGWTPEQVRSACVKAHEMLRNHLASA